jgi:ATP-binding cassette subfamily B protein
MARPEAPRQVIDDALRRAGIFEKVAAFGLDSPLGEAGRTLSGGERQRIQLARALVQDARVLLLDEATNQVDAETEAAIVADLQKIKPGRTIVMVAHHLAAIRDADRIAVLDGGRLVELGSHAELLANPGRYAELWRAVPR